MALALLALFSAAAPAQTAHFSGSIVTLGGGFTSPDGVAVDGAGNVYMTDYATNVVKEIPAGCASSTCVTTLGGGFSNLYGAAVDGGGNVYVADSGHSAIKKVPPGCAASSCVTVQGGIGILIPVGVAVDGSGNVYAGAHGSGEVQEIPLGCTSLGCVTTLGGGFAGVDGVAADGSGNVYVASGSGAVKKMPAGCASSSCVASLGGITSADYVAVDGSGNVYITYGPANEVQELPVGCSSSSCVIGLGSGFNDPSGVAVDGHGNVYVADSNNAAVKELMLKSVDFFSAPVGSAGPVRTLTFTFDATVVISSVRVLTMGAANQDFTNAGTGSCIGLDKHTYGPGDTCTIDVAFSPKWAGTRNGAVILTNPGGGPIATAYIHGVGTGPQVVFTPSAISTLGGDAFVAPNGVAVDGGGNVYMADYPASEVYEIPAGCASFSCVTTLGGGLSNPSEVAVDGAGNVYVAETGHNAIKEMPAGCTSSSCVTTLGGGFSFPIGVAVDGSGNVYVSAHSANTVMEMPPGCASSGCVTTLGGGFFGPEGVAVDGGGNVYVADYGHDLVKEMPPGCATSSCVTTLGGGFTNPASVAVDGSGNVYVADIANTTVTVMPAGCASSSCVTPLGSGFLSPFGVAVDGSGNVYVGDNGNHEVKEIGRATPPSLGFASTQFGATSSDSPKTVTVQNIGNATLTFPLPTTGDNPSVSTNFRWNNTSTCGQTSTSSSTPFTLAEGAICGIAIDFSPTIVASISGSAVLTDNALNVHNATQSISLTGLGNKATPNVSTWPTAGAITYGQTLASSTLTGGAASVPGTFAWSVPTIAPHAGLQSRSVTFTPTDAADYDPVTGYVTVSVKKVTPTVSKWPAASTITYGQTLSSSTLTGATTSVPGAFKWTVPSIVPTAGSQSRSVTFTPTDSTDYNTVIGLTTITVNKATPTVSPWPTASAISYGQTLAASTLTGGAASVPGTFAWSVPSIVPHIGVQSRSVTFTPTDSTDYNTVSGYVTITVNKATPTVSPWPTASTITFGQTLAASTLTGGTASVPGTFAWSVPSIVPHIGVQSRSVTFTPTDTTDYNTVSGYVTITVNKATPTVSPWPTASTITFGQTLASSTLTGGAASVAGTFAWSAPSIAPYAGVQSRSVTFTPTDTTDYNTVIGYVTITVNKATPTIIWATPAPITHGTALSATQLDASSPVAGTFVYSPASGTVLASGQHTLSVTLNPTDTTDYTTANTSVTLTVN